MQTETHFPENIPKPCLFMAVTYRGYVASCTKKAAVVRAGGRPTLLSHDYHADIDSGYRIQRARLLVIS